MTSLAASLAPLARALITPEGVPLTFSRTVAAPYDPIQNLQGPATTTTWTGVGMFVKNASGEATHTRAETGELRTLRTLLCAGDGLAAPEPGDRVTAVGITYTVGPVTRVADTAGVVPLYRVQVSA